MPPTIERELTSLVPHLLPGVREWIMENGFTPEMVVDTSVAGVDVPIAYIKNNMFILAVHSRNCRNVDFQKDGVSVGTRFNRVHVDCFIPYDSVVALRAREAPVLFPFNTAKVRLMEKGESPSAREVDRVEVGKVEFGDVIRATKGGRFGVVDGSKNDD